MSLNQKYTWQDFLKEYPEHKEKKTRRTSGEGKKAFESAYKSFIKKYLSGRAEKVGKDITLATKRREQYVSKLKETRKTGKCARARVIQEKIGRFDSAIARLSKQQGKAKEKQKSV